MHILGIEPQPVSHHLLDSSITLFSVEWFQDILENLPSLVKGLYTSQPFCKGVVAGLFFVKSGVMKIHCSQSCSRSAAGVYGSVWYRPHEKRLVHGGSDEYENGKDAEEQIRDIL